MLITSDKNFWLHMKSFGLSENSISSPTALIICLVMENKTISFIWVKPNAKLKNNKKNCMGNLVGDSFSFWWAQHISNFSRRLYGPFPFWLWNLSCFSMTCITRLGILLSHLEGRRCSIGYALGRKIGGVSERVFPCCCDNAAALLLMFLGLAMHMGAFL